MATIYVDNPSWIQITTPGDVPIQFVNASTQDITVVFTRVVANVAGRFSVYASQSRHFVISSMVGNGRYSFSTSNGSSGNGGIEINR